MKLIERSLLLIEQRSARDKANLPPWLDAETLHCDTVRIKNKILMLLIIGSERNN